MSPRIHTPNLMRQILSLFLVSTTVGCGRQSMPSTAATISVGRVAQPPVALADPADPIGVTAKGLTVARVALPGDTAYRLVDSAGSVVGVAAVSGVGAWLAGEDDLFYTLTPDAMGIATIKPDGSAGPSFRLAQPGILRGVGRDSVDLLRPGAQGFAMVRAALTGGERVILAEGIPEVGVLLGISAGGLLGTGPRGALVSTTTTIDRVVLGNGQTYRILVFSAAGQPIGTIERSLDTMPRVTERQIETEVRQLLASGQQLNDAYLKIVRRQLAKERLPFFAPAQGFRYDGGGRLWVVGYEGDSTFADIFSDTIFVRRFSLGCYGFDGQWDLKGDWLALSCGHRDPAIAGGELHMYRIR